MHGRAPEPKPERPSKYSLIRDLIDAFMSPSYRAELLAKGATMKEISAAQDGLVDIAKVLMHPKAHKKASPFFRLLRLLDRKA